MNISATIGERLVQARRQAGLSQMDLSTKTGISQNSISRYERNERIPKADIVVQICNVLGISSEWLMGSKKVNTPNEVGSLPNIPDHLYPPAHCESNQTDAALVMVPLVEARLSAGTGSLETSGEIERSYAFRSDFLRKKGNPKNMVLMRVGGDSMQPEIMNNDMVLLDQSKRDLRPGPIFAVGFEEAIYLKRIDTLPGKIILKSTNPAYPPVEIPVGEQEGDAFRIIGQVIWCGREY